MNRRTLLTNRLRYNRRTNAAVVLGAVTACAALTGALLVGDSMRASLRAVALRRLGPVTHALTAHRFITARLAADVLASTKPESGAVGGCPLILLRASATHADSQARAGNVQVLGIDGQFANLFAGYDSTAALHVDGLRVVLNQPLADDLHAAPGDDVLLRFESHGSIPLETLLGRRDENAAALRLTVAAVIPADGPGAFSPTPSQFEPRSAFVPLKTIQRTINQPERVNAILLRNLNLPNDGHTPPLQSTIKNHWRLADVDVTIRAEDAAGFAALESSRLLIEPPIETAALDIADQHGFVACPILTYLANSIEVDRSHQLPDVAYPPSAGHTPTQKAPAPSIPYSTVAALDFANAPARGAFLLSDGAPAEPLGYDQIYLNQWAADDLGVKPGDRVALTYYVTRSPGRLETRRATFTLRGVLKMTGWAADAGITPTYPGVTDAKRISDWDPPFPMDMRRIRDKDEVYWDAHQALPKAFISLDRGRALWATDHERFGSLTSIRFHTVNELHAMQIAEQLERGLLNSLDPSSLGLALQPVRTQALAAAAGNTDFGMLFIGFSFFLIAAAAMLVALLFRLGIERGASEIGLLLALGYRVRQVSALLVAEGLVLVSIGAVAGLAAAVGYAWLMLAGLRTWWSAAAHAPFLTLAVSPLSLALGLLASVAVALLSIVWAVRGVARTSPRALLAGVTTSGRTSDRGRNRRRVGGLIFVCTSAAVVLGAMAAGDRIQQAGAFFGIGGALLVALLASFWLSLTREPQARPDAAARFSILRLAVRGAGRRPGRSILATGLVACATFVIVAVGANRRAPDEQALAQTGGTGGYRLFAESVVPLPYDLGSPKGRASLGLPETVSKAMVDASLAALRLRPGDDTSCLNLYQSVQPRILGAPDEFLRRGGFRFAAADAESAEENTNPWLLLRRTFDDGAIPAIGDEASVRWLLHLGLGDDLTVLDERGRPTRLRIVAMLAGSVLQSELVIAENHFTKLFPSIAGHAFFLIEVNENDAAVLESELERGLARFGFDVQSTTDRLTRYLAVENTYLSTFQTLGGLGLVLGTLGLAAVMLRNVLERRGELALMRALGHRVRTLFRMVTTELAALLAAGLLIGGLAALLAVAPHVASQPDQVPWGSLAFTLLAVFVVGMCAAGAALRAALRTGILPALRTE